MNDAVVSGPTSMLLVMRRARAHSFLRARTQRAVVNRRVFPYLALTTLTVAVGAGFLMTIVDSKDFPTLEDGVWWAIVTLATVGYGDIVPTTPVGRVVGSVVIIFGVTFISFLTATVTSAFVAAEQREASERERRREEAFDAEVLEILRQLGERLMAIEARLGRGPS